MTSYYNEIDPYAAQWLRNLIDAGHIAPGFVDTRSIEEVTPDDLAGYTQCHFFAGLGGWALALDLAGWPRDRPVWTGSCPCQPFSSAGKRDGFDDERHLWPAWQHLIAERRPPVIFGEQVASKAAAPWIDLVHADMEGLDYAFGCVPFPAAGIGAPHIRDRNYWVAYANHQRRLGQRPLLRPEAARRYAPDLLEATGRRKSNRLADTTSVGRVGWGAGETSAEFRQIERSDGFRDARGLADAHCESAGRDPGATHGSQASHGPQDRDGDGSRNADGLRPFGMGNPECDGLRSGWWKDADVADKSGDRPIHTTSAPGAGPTNGQWGNADWLRCTDGKWRAVEPGTFPLAHGVSGRVGRLRAYGNAIVPQQAAHFIEAFVEAQAEGEVRTTA